MKSKENGLMPVIILLVVLLMGISTLAVISISEESIEEVEIPEPPNLYSSSQHVIGTGNKLGTYYPAGKALADWFNSHLESKSGTFKAFETKGSIDNIQLLESGRIQFGFTEARIAKEAYSRSKKLRVIWPLWLDVVQLLKPPAPLVPNYVFPSRLKGYIGQKHSSTARTSNEIFEALGIRGRHSVDVPTHTVLGAVTDGRLGFAMIQAGIPNSSISDALLYNNCELISFSKEDVDRIITKVDTSVPFTIPNGYYCEKQPEISTIGLPNLLITTSDTTPEQVEFITDLLVKASNRLKGNFAAFETVPDNSEAALKILNETGIPIHEGTKRWLDKNAASVHEEGANK